MIDSLTTPDPRTVVIKMAFPYGAITELLAYWYLMIMPREAEDKFDPKQQAFGSGPFSINRFETNIALEYRKNPDWYEKGRPYLDGINMIVIPEYSAALAQFESKATWTMDGIRQEDILRTKRDNPDLVLQRNAIIGAPSSQVVQFSGQPTSPLRDVRLRRALSLLIDRDLVLDTFYNLPEFRNAGLPAESPWSSNLTPQSFNWMDPRDKEFGPNAVWFQHNVEEAKKLISATGVTSLDFWWRPTAGNFQQVADLSDGMWREGLNINRRVADATSTWRVYKESNGRAYDGIFSGTAFGYNDDSVLASKYTPTGRDNTLAGQAIPGITDAVIKIRNELDAKKRGEMIKQVQRDLAPLVPDIEYPTGMDPYSLRWPWIKNHGVFTASGFNLLTSSARLYTTYWYDASAKV
jgi:peptide/nickel transport system substrate-binding protein